MKRDGNLLSKSKVRTEEVDRGFGGCSFIVLVGTMKETKTGKKKKDTGLSCYPSGKTGTNETSVKTPPNKRKQSRADR